ncbi:hypothetical protein R5O87_09645 [Arthrobacter globiformis]|uniref:hypothetical protein n=1 Tax=Arthrobacter globiformis TaxID=1665 RepID=UPI00397D5C91
MVNIPDLIAALLPDELERLRSGGPGHILDGSLTAAIDRAAGGTGEGRGYYVVRGHLWPVEAREYHLREDVAEHLFGPALSAPDAAVT